MIVKKPFRYELNVSNFLILPKAKCPLQKDMCVYTVLSC